MRFLLLNVPPEQQVITGFTTLAILVSVFAFLSYATSLEDSIENRLDIIEKLRRKFSPYNTRVCKERKDTTYSKNYWARQSILDQYECAFYQEIRKVIPPQFLIIPKVPLRDIFIKDKLWNDRGEYYAKCHIDFLVVNPSEEFRTIFAIELDGSSHDNPKVQKRDKFKNKLFSSCQIPLERFGVAESYDLLAIQDRIAPHLAGK